MTSRRNVLRRPRPGSHNKIDFDVLRDLLSFYMRSVGAALNRDLDARISDLELGRGTGKISTLLLVSANPGVRPSVIAHHILKDRSAMTRVLNELKRRGLLREIGSSEERRAHALYLTERGEDMAARLRRIAVRQSDAFFALLSPAECSELNRILQKVYWHLLEPEE